MANEDRVLTTPNAVAKKDAASQPGTSVSVSNAASTVVAAANRDRAEITICNDGANIVYLRLAGTGATANQGIRLNANGGSWTSGAYTGAVCGIAMTAATVVTVSEV